MSTPNRRGRRTPDLVPTADSPEMQIIADAALAPNDEQPEGPEEGPPSLLSPGAKIESSITLAVDFGDGKTNFIKHSATDIVLEGEHSLQARERLHQEVLDGVITLVDDAQDLLKQYEAELQRRQAAIDRQTSGQ